MKAFVAERLPGAGLGVRAVEVSRLSEASVWVGKQRMARRTARYVYCESWEEALAERVRFLDDRVRAAEFRYADALQWAETWKERLELEKEYREQVRAVTVEPDAVTIEDSRRRMAEESRKAMARYRW